MNNGETNIVNDPLTGALAPITRIGGGEVRVDRARYCPGGCLGQGCATAAPELRLRRCRGRCGDAHQDGGIRNLDNKKHTYTVTPTFRFANDMANGAVYGQRTGAGGGQTRARAGYALHGHHDHQRRDAARQFMNSGSNGANPAR